MGLSWLWNWWRRPRRLARLRVVMYTRRGCHLCEEAWALLTERRQRYGFLLEAVDVDADAELKAQHGDWVPVVTFDGKVRFRGGVNRALLERLLLVEARKSTEY
jgi:glutaredoxin